MKKDFYKTRGDRKYLSIVDEYRRYYVTGKNFKIKNAKGKKMGDKIFRLCVNEILRPIIKAKITDKENLSYENLISRQKIGNTKYRKNILIADFKENRNFILQYSDDQKNVYRIHISSKSNLSNKINYSEWVKKDKTFFGLTDTAGKIFMRRGVVKKSKMLKSKINKILFNIIKSKNKQSKTLDRNYEDSIEAQSKTRGFIRRGEIKYNNDLAAKYDKNLVAPDLTSSELSGLENNLTKAEEMGKKGDE